MIENSEYQARAGALAAFLRTHSEMHDQSHYGVKTDCGTTACVAGWAGLAQQGWVSFTPAGELVLDPLLSLGDLVEDSTGDAFGAARRWLGLSGATADFLFLRVVGWGRSEDFAVALLEALADGRLSRDFDPTDPRRPEAEYELVSAISRSVVER